MYSLGIDIGYSAIKTVLIDEHLRIVFKDYQVHHGQINKKLTHLLKSLKDWDIKYIGITGSGHAVINDESLYFNEVTTQIEGSKGIMPTVNGIISMGGQSAVYINHVHDGLMNVSLNSSCAAGTGSFLEEQVHRMNLTVDAYNHLETNDEDIPRIAGRCSVFAKSDIIHHQQEGVSSTAILKGLAEAVVKSYRGSIVGNYDITGPLLFVGGLSKNNMIVESMRKFIGAEIIVHKDSDIVSALGAAYLALSHKKSSNIDWMLNHLEEHDIEHFDQALQTLKTFGTDNLLEKHEIHPMGTSGYLGIDIGSTSTNLVVMNEKVLAYRYIKTLGDSVKAVSEGLESLMDELGEDFEIKGVATTGSGRYLIGNKLGAHLIKDEITAQASGATFIDPEIDTIFEIGGQDSKFIRLKDGKVNRFQMNKVCAAGTGAFLEEQAKKLNLSLDEFVVKALSSDRPVDLGDRCTVFIESSIQEKQSRGVSLEDITSGLCYAIVKNYLNKVVGYESIGEHISFQGGLSYNQGVVNAFRAVTGKNIKILPYFSVMGALGVAVMLRDQVWQHQSLADVLNQLTFDHQQVKKSLPQDKDELFMEGYDDYRDPNKKTVGIPRVLFLHKLFPAFHKFFKTLGFNVVLTKPTDDEIIGLSQKYPVADACYPIKLVHGHVAKLVQEKVDYIFLPSLETMKHEISKTRCNYGCIYMQNLSRLVDKSMKMDIEILSPTLSFQFGKKQMMNSMVSIGKKLGFSSVKTVAALQKGMMQLNGYIKATEKKGQALVNELKDDEIAFVMITRAYGIKDPVLNMGIPKIVKAMGYRVLTLSQLPAHSVDLSVEHHNMYWPFGQHMISGAKIINEHPNLYAIYLTNHGCGPDTVISKYFDEAMTEKPYLHIEVDEHASAVGIKTRIEAFINSISHEKRKARCLTEYPSLLKHENKNIEYDIEFNQDRIYHMPSITPYSKVISNHLNEVGLSVQILKPTHKESLEEGFKHVQTKEYYSLVGLIGDALISHGDLLIPTYEGTEVHGQYHRIIRHIFDRKGMDRKITAPFIEDLVYSKTWFKTVMTAVMKSDLIALSPSHMREAWMEEIMALKLTDLAEHIRTSWEKTTYKKTVFALGEPMILFNDYLNHNILKDLEKEHRVVTMPMSEMLYHQFSRHVKRSKKKEHGHLKWLKSQLNKMHDLLKEYSSFSMTLDLEEPLYTLSKLKSDDSWDGCILMSSMYENTSTVVSMLNDSKKAILPVNLDRTLNEQTKLSIETFIHYLN